MTAEIPNLEDAADPATGIDHGLGSRTIEATENFKPSRKWARIKIGGVYVTGERASTLQARQAVADSTAMLERLGNKIAQPGVRLNAARNIPLFFVDPKHPGRFLRRLNGKVDQGVLENGTFKVVD